MVISNIREDECNKLNFIKKEIRKHTSLTIKQSRIRKDELPTGKYIYSIDPNTLKFTDKIRLYCQTGDVDYKPHLLASVAIHEFGHHLMMGKTPLHSEIEAWEAGRNYFLKLNENILPLKFNSTQQYFLWTYGIGDEGEFIRHNDIERTD